MADDDNESCDSDKIKAFLADSEELGEDVNDEASNDSGGEKVSTTKDYDDKEAEDLDPSNPDEVDEKDAEKLLEEYTKETPLLPDAGEDEDDKEDTELDLAGQEETIDSQVKATQEATEELSISKDESTDEIEKKVEEAKDDIEEVKQSVAENTTNVSHGTELDAEGQAKLAATRKKAEENKIKREKKAADKDAKDKAHMDEWERSETARTQRAYSWYTRMGMPKRDAFKKKVANLPATANLEESDVDLLPWNSTGTRVNVAKMTSVLMAKPPKRKEVVEVEPVHVKTLKTKVYEDLDDLDDDV